MFVAIYILLARADEGTAPPPPPVAEDTDSADSLYMEGLRYWQLGQWLNAQQAAEKALAIDPNHRPAMLLEGYAMMKRRQKKDGALKLKALSELPVSTSYEEKIHKQARNISLRYLDRFERTQISITAGNTIPVERRFDTLVSEPGMHLALTVPTLEHFQTRLSMDFIWPSSLSISGTQLVAQELYLVPLGAGRFSFDLGVGPALWLAQGAYWPDQGQPYVGAQVSSGIDWRFSKHFALRAEVDGWWWPGLYLDQKWYGRPVDLNLSFTVFFGKRRENGIFGGHG